MPPELPYENDPKVWLKFAYADYALASGPRVPEAFPFLYCYHAQQCAEKAIKALMVHRRIENKKTHDIELLLQMLEAKGEMLPPSVRAATELTQYAFRVRYPKVPVDPADDNLELALTLARTVYDWAADAIKRT